MYQIEVVTALKVATMLDKLNNAKNVYEKTTNQHIQQEADRTFADCYDWFIQQSLAIEYDKKLHCWLFMGWYHETFACTSTLSSGIACEEDPHLPDEK